MGLTSYEENLNNLKQFWVSRYNECENPQQQEDVKALFAEALAKLYGAKPNDEDVRREVNLELDIW
jgi:hypothetical protein